MSQATISCEITMSMAALAGPRSAILRMTVTVIKAPMTPPRSAHLSGTSSSVRKLCPSLKAQARRQTISAVSCTKEVETQRLVAFVTSVLKTP